MRTIFEKLSVLMFLTLLFVFGYSFAPVSEWLPADAASASKEILVINKRVLAYKSYSFSVAYKTYKDHTSSNAYQKQNGYIIKEGLNYRAEVMGRLIVQNKDLRVTVDTAAKLIKVSNPLEGVEPNLDPTTYVKAMQGCRQLKHSISDGLTGYRFEMKAKRGLIVQELFFDSDFMKKLVYYYVNVHSIRENNRIKEEIVYPRVSIEISNFKLLEKVDKTKFDTNDLVMIRKGKLVAAEKYRGFKILDGRYPK